jgi:hypothetical protein
MEPPIAADKLMLGAPMAQWEQSEAFDSAARGQLLLITSKYRSAIPALASAAGRMLHA